MAMTDAQRQALVDLIAEAESKGLWLRCHYQDLWFSPKELRAAHADWRFWWGVVNWELRDPQELVAIQQKQIDYQVEELNRIKIRMEA